MLDPAELEIHDLCQGSHGEGLGQSGIALEERVAVAENRDEDLLNDLLLPDDDLAHLLLELVKKLFVILHVFTSLIGILLFCWL